MDIESEILEVLETMDVFLERIAEALERIVELAEREAGE